MPPRRDKEKRGRKGPSLREKTAMTEFPIRKRSHLLEGVKTIDQNDSEFLRKFVTEHGKILPARLTGASSKQQRTIRRLVRRTRVMGLLP